MATAKQKAQWKRWQAAGAVKKHRRGASAFYSVVFKGGAVGASLNKKSNALRVVKKNPAAIGVVKHVGDTLKFKHY